nr:hypothetical protein [Tanacetum cinerariifolium]
ASSAAAPGIARRVRGACRRAGSGSWCPLPANVAATCAATGAGSGRRLRAWVRPVEADGRAPDAPDASRGCWRSGPETPRRSDHAAWPSPHRRSPAVLPCLRGQTPARRKAR